MNQRATTTEKNLHHACLNDVWWEAVCKCSSGQPGEGPVDNGSVEEADQCLSPLQRAVEAGVVPHVQLKALAETLGLSYAPSLGDYAPSAEFVEQIPIDFARRHQVLGLASEEGSILVAMGNVQSWEALDGIARFLGRDVEPLPAAPDAVMTAINHAYQERSGQTQSLIDSFDRDEILSQLGSLPEKSDLLDVSDRSPVIKLVNLILFEAAQAKASDVHIQPYEDRLVIRQRIDGMLFDTFTVPKGLQEEVISRVKVIGKMNIAEKRLPQDGRATVRVGDRMIDLRIASLPTSYGERIVIRLLDKSARLYTLTELGMESTLLSQFHELIRLEHGLILVTGPTGSGKSTTLYASLQEIDATNLNVVTLEDPIEYQLEGISQTQISDKKGMTFASGLRSVLRQDPDIIMVGEIRDQETAAMAIQSSMTGHLVFSTLHTNDAASAITRLIDLGIEPYLVASSVIAVLAQRLVRTICPDCVETYSPNEQELHLLGLDDSALSGQPLWRGRGCTSCRNTGYQGRVGVFELLPVSDPVRQEIQQQANSADIRSTAEKHGMRLLREDGLAKILTKTTTIEEVTRVTVRSTM